MHLASNFVTALSERRNWSRTLGQGVFVAFALGPISTAEALTESPSSGEECDIGLSSQSGAATDLGARHKCQYEHQLFLHLKVAEDGSSGAHILVPDICFRNPSACAPSGNDHVLVPN